jgi:MOSC domain-containing protein
MTQVVGRVAELWRYPVKSMLGERRESLGVDELGVVGDRAWALREVSSGRIASAKKHPRLLDFRATYETEPTRRALGRVRIDAPDGSAFHADDADASAILSEWLGSPLVLESTPREGEKTAIDPATVFGDVPVSSLKPEWTPETMPDYFQLMSKTFLEIGPIYLLTSGSVEHLRSLRGEGAVVDRRCFRPNIYIESAPEREDFVEDTWIGGALEIGELRCIDFQRTLWCVTSTLAQQGIPRDLGILRTLAEHHEGCLGVYGAVESGGRVRVDAPVAFVPSPA